MILILSKALVYTAVFSFLLTPLDFGLARATGAIDIPTDGRRMHTRPTPRLGGISLFAAFVVFSLIFRQRTEPDYLFVLSGAFITVILGVIDDSIGLSATFKLTVQSVAAAVAIMGALIYRNLSAVLAIVGFFLLISLINAHNFIDGLDGLCIGVSLIEALSLGTLFLVQGKTSEVLTAFVLGGACVGFYPFNAPRAKLFMGDTGATFLGFILGSLALSFFIDYHNTRAAVALLFIFSVPLADIIYAVVRRLKKGKSPFVADRSHIHHVLADALGKKNASFTLQFLTLAMALIGILIYIAL